VIRVLTAYRANARMCGDVPGESEILSGDQVSKTKMVDSFSAEMGMFGSGVFHLPSGPTGK
jgi:hypothetical protein